MSEEGFPSPDEAQAAAAAASAAAAGSAGAWASALGMDAAERGKDGREAHDGSAPPQDPEELDDMIKAVQAVLGGTEEPGGLGDGFVEACLSVFGWSPQVRMSLSFYLYH